MKYRSLSLSIVGITMAIMLLPGFLAYSERPEKAEAIMLITGPVMNARWEEALQLQDQGLGRLILIPAKGLIVGKNESLSRLPARTRGQGSSHWPGRTWICHHAEDTHRELLMGKMMMDALGLHSANIVSSPYHMRRISIIAGQIFASPPYRLRFVPTPYGPQPSLLWWLKPNEAKWIVSEYAKLAWFKIYSPFCHT